MKKWIISVTLLAGMLSTERLAIAQNSAPLRSAAAESKVEDRIRQLQVQSDQAETKVQELANQLRASRDFSHTDLGEDLESLREKFRSDEQMRQLQQAIEAALDVKLKLQHAQLDEAETKIAASRKLLDERRNQHTAIATEQLRKLLSVPPNHVSPQAVLFALEHSVAAKDYGQFVTMLSDDEADRMAGMLILSMQTMTYSLALLEHSNTNVSDKELQQFRSIASVIEQYMRPNPPPAAIAAMEKVRNILPAFLYQLGATSNGQPLRRPNLNAKEYAALLREASGVLSDSRAFCAAMLTAASAMEEADVEPPLQSQWKIDVEGVQAIARQMNQPIDKTTLKTVRVELVVEKGLWKVSQLGSDEELMAAIGGPEVGNSNTQTSITE